MLVFHLSRDFQIQISHASKKTFILAKYVYIWGGGFLLSKAAECSGVGHAFSTSDHHGYKSLPAQGSYNCMWSHRQWKASRYTQQVNLVLWENCSQKKSQDGFQEPCQQRSRNFLKRPSGHLCLGQTERRMPLQVMCREWCGICSGKGTEILCCWQDRA